MAETSKERTKKELELLLEATKEVLKFGSFEETARKIFNSCKELTGASAGYVALLSKTGEENEVLFLDSGGRECNVDPYLPMPVRGLRGEAYKMQKVVYDNNFMNSKHVKYMPKGHVVMPNVLFVPLNIEDKTVGVIGLSNKDGDFTDTDANIVTAFGDICSIALRNSWLIQNENEMLEKLSNLNQSLELINSILKHDIINDLQIVSNSVELFTRREHDSDLLENIKIRLENSVELIHRMNEFEQLILKDEKELKLVNLREIVNQIIRNYETEDVEISVCGSGSVFADQAIYSVIDNLLNNAVKHADTDKIEIIVEKRDDKIVLEIRDFGKGLPEEIANMINTGEYKIDKSIISQLGLYIVCKTMKRYSGLFTTEPNSPNGTIMKLSFDNPEEHRFH